MTQWLNGVDLESTPLTEHSDDAIVLEIATCKHYTEKILSVFSIELSTYTVSLVPRPIGLGTRLIHSRTPGSVVWE